ARSSSARSTSSRCERRMTQPMLAGQRILVTQAGDFMGPVLCEVLASHGATVLESSAPLDDPAAPARAVAAAGPADVPGAHPAAPARSTEAHAVHDDEWRHTFAHMVDPLPRLVRAVLPQMTQRQRGRIVVMGSAAALRGQRRTSTYSAARGAQLAYVQAVGV